MPVAVPEIGDFDSSPAKVQPFNKIRKEPITTETVHDPTAFFAPRGIFATNTVSHEIDCPVSSVAVPTFFEISCSSSGVNSR